MNAKKRWSIFFLLAAFLFKGLQGPVNAQTPTSHSAFTNREWARQSRRFSRKTVWRQIALTFDDGPDKINTPKILDILRTEKIVATFFVIGEKVEWYPAMTKSIFDDGHLIANHSHTHADLSGLSNQEIIDLELEPTSAAIEKITGNFPMIMRPPYGSLRSDTAQFLNSEGWTIVRWSLDTFDWDKTRNNPADIVARVSQLHHANAIILMHCNGRETIDALPDVIQSLRDLGYGFVTVSQLLNLES